MKRLLFLVVVGLSVPTGAPKGNLARHDQDQLQGTWELMTLEASVQHVSSLCLEDLADARLGVGENVWRYKLGKTNLKMTYRLDPGKNPKSIDLTITAGPAKGKTFRAIYILERDTLKICHHLKPGNKRPAEFEPGRNGEFVVVTWKRAHIPEDQGPHHREITGAYHATNPDHSVSN
jgi:uncharacterized protein (TIGR03067 family)